jgi:N-methylhydantoinase A
VHTVGAGGGSIARVDPGGLLHVGPESAGASPGPACYGRNGPSTVTDALVVLGRIAGDSLAGGTLALDRAAARRAMEKLATSLGLGGAEKAAEGVLVVAEALIEAALRKVSVERGHDPREAALVAFGGAGGLHACPVAEALGCTAVLFPERAGVLSALGALGAESRRERSRSVLLAASDRAAIERALDSLEREVRAQFPPRARGASRMERRAEVRYRGQSHEVSLPVGADLEARFHREHARRFGFSDPARAVEVVTLEARGWVPAERGPRGASRTAPRSRGGRPSAPARVRHAGRWLAVPVWDRDAMGAAAIVRGPAIVRESGATLWVPPAWSGRLHGSGTLVLLRGRG